eukprot:g1546.t1
MMMDDDDSSIPSVLVRIVGPDARYMKHRGFEFFMQKKGKTILSCSGFHFGNGNILTSANLFAPFLSSVGGTVGNEPSLLNNTQISVREEDKKFENGYRWVSAELVQFFPPNDQFLKSLRSLLPASEFPLSKNGMMYGTLALLRMHSSKTKIDRIIRPSMATAATNVNVNVKEPSSTFQQKRGDKIIVISSPFAVAAPAVFQSSITVGVISNILPGLILTDARSLAGSEGGLALSPSTKVFGSQRMAIGIIMPSLKFFKPLTIVQMLNPKLSSFIVPRIPRTLQNHNQEMDDQGTTVNKNSVVMLKIGSAWGSGIITTVNLFCDAPHCYIMTCAHLLLPFLYSSNCAEKEKGDEISSFSGSEVLVGDEAVPQGGNIKARLNTNGRYDWYSAKVVVLCKDFLDVALLRVSIPEISKHDLEIESVPIAIDAACARKQCEKENGSIPLCTSSSWQDYCLRVPSAGEVISVVGHAKFGPGTFVPPSISQGILSKVVFAKKNPILLQSSAMVLKGHSGGGIFDGHGNILGMITSHAQQHEYDSEKEQKFEKESDSGEEEKPVIEHLNFALPMNLLWPLFNYANCDAWRRKQEGHPDVERQILAPLLAGDIQTQLETIWSVEEEEEGESEQLLSRL